MAAADAVRVNTLAQAAKLLHLPNGTLRDVEMAMDTWCVGVGGQ